MRCEFARRLRDVANTDTVANKLISETPDLPVTIPKGAMGPEERSRKWRELNRETYNIRQRDLMRKKRAAKSA